MSWPEDCLSPSPIPEARLWDLREPCDPSDGTARGPPPPSSLQLCCMAGQAGLIPISQQSGVLWGDAGCKTAE